eukprot:gene201-393_t
MTLHHRATIPALAYVVEGKTQRRHLLLGGEERGRGGVSQVAVLEVL